MVSNITGTFLKVKCKKCNNEQNIFSKASTEVRCLVCQEILSEKTGGASAINTKILHTHE